MHNVGEKQNREDFFQNLNPSVLKFQSLNQNTKLNIWPIPQTCSAQNSANTKVELVELENPNFTT